MGRVQRFLLNNNSNETTSEENKKFGKIVDVLYKLGRGMDYMSFAF